MAALALELASLTIPLTLLSKYELLGGGLILWNVMFLGPPAVQKHEFLYEFKLEVTLLKLELYKFDMNSFARLFLRSFKYSLNTVQI